VNDMWVQLGVGPAWQLKRWLIWVYNRVCIADLGLSG
jgi:hypothetical protein